MKQIAHTINRDGKTVPANGFKQPTPTVAMQNHNIWHHSIERYSSPTEGLKSFIVAIAFLIVAIGVIYFLAR